MGHSIRGRSGDAAGGAVARVATVDAEASRGVLAPVGVGDRPVRQVRYFRYNPGFMLRKSHSAWHS
jgi:hypothetical protein